MASNWLAEGKSEYFNKYIIILSTFIFCAVLCYIICLGMTNVLRFHYMRELEDQIFNVYQKNGIKINEHDWMTFSSPLTTRNIFHIKSVFTGLHYTNYTIATICAIAFCITILYIEYTIFGEKDAVTTFCTFLNTTIGLMASISFLFSFKSEKIYEFCKRKSKENFKIRNNKFIEKNKKFDFQTVAYYIYPKQKDFQKSMLIIVGYISGVFLNKGINFKYINFWYIILSWIIFDFLFYQVRYLLNDLRNINEDKKMQRTNRLPIHNLGERKACIYAIITIIIKTSLLFIIVISLPRILKIRVVITLGLLVFSTVLYELSRKYNFNKLIFIFVSFGYPLRYLGGYLFSGNIQLNSLLILIVISLLFYGAYCAIMPWGYEIKISLKQNKPIYKSHYIYISEKYSLQSNRDLINDPILFKGFWDYLFILSVLILSLFNLIYYNCFVFELLFLLVVLTFSLRKENIKVLELVIMILIKVLEITLIYKVNLIYVCLLQIFYIFSYYFDSVKNLV